MVDTTIIKILCKKLPGDLSNAVYNEYVGRWEDIENIWKYPQNRFKVLQEYETTIQNLLAFSTFYRRVLSGFNGARDFYKTVSKSLKARTQSPTISIGKYRLDQTAYNKLLGVQIEFGKIKNKFGIEDSFFKYYETEEFMTNCMRLYMNHFNSERRPNGGSEELPF